MVKGKYMKKLSSFFTCLFLLIIVAGFCFYLGYSPLKVSNDSCGVLISKTNGVDSTPIENGKFRWDWQLLIPTNAQIRTFSLKPYSFSKTKTGVLPSADVYSKQFKELPDFSYSFTFDIEIQNTANKCVELVKKSKIASDSDLKKSLEPEIENLINNALQIIWTELEKNPNSILDLNLIQDKIIANHSKANFVITRFNIVTNKIPDIELYSKAKKIYIDYVSSVEQSLKKLADNQAKEISEYTKNLDKLEKFAKVLKNNPELAEFLKSSKDMNETLKTIYSLQ